jgi:hypothetical protein
MAAAVKFNNFIVDLTNGVHKNGVNTGSPTDNWAFYLTNTTPDVAADSVKGDLAEISLNGGYGGAQSIALQRSQSGGIITLSGTDVVWTASGSPSFPSFRWLVLANLTPVSPLMPLIAYWDYASVLSLESGQTFTADLGASLATIQ